MTIGDLLVEIASKQPDAVAIVDEHAGAHRAIQLTYGELESDVAAAAGWLRSLGLKRGDAVLVFVPMSADLYVALLAMFRLGVVALFLDPSAGREHMERCCARWSPAALLAIPKAHLLRLRSAALRRIPLKVAVGGWVPFAKRWPREPHRRRTGSAELITASLAEPGDAALVTFTSGSTGVPKGAVRTHAFLLAQYRALAPSIELVAGETDLATLPVFTLANLAAGVTTVIPAVDLRRPGAVEAATLFEEIARLRITRITASPAFFERLIDHGVKTGQFLPSLTKLHTGGAPVFPRLLSSLRQLAPNAQVVAVYGSTEAEPIAHVGAEEITPADLDAMRSGRGLLAGVPVPEIKIRVVRDRWGEPRKDCSAAEFEAERLPVDAAGEIVVAGEHVLSGYLGGIGDEETKFRVEGEVWHRTGDAGLFDQSGRLWLLGRCAARIQDEHGTLYPFGTECAAMTFPEVRRAAVLLHDRKRLLILETASGTAPPPLLPRLRQATAPARLDRIHVVDRLPVDARHNAKIDYTALRALVATLPPST